MIHLAADEHHETFSEVVDVYLAHFGFNITVVGSLGKLVLDQMIPGVPLPDDFGGTIVEIRLQLNDLVEPDCIGSCRKLSIPTHRTNLLATEPGIRDGQDVAIWHVVDVMVKHVLLRHVHFVFPDNVAVPIEKLHGACGADRIVLAVHPVMAR